MEIQRPVQIDPALRVLRNRPHEVAEPAHLAFEVQPGVADTPLAPVQREPDRLCRIVRSPRQCPQVERSEEHTSELQSLMRISYAVFCLKKKKKQNKQQ